MEKHWRHQHTATTFNTLDECTDAAKRYCQKGGYDKITIYEAVAYVNTPAPAYEVVKI